ncbi:hypothetical protein HPB49_008299 [Dermacentor silvarum]|uniref:Uncharacterized protein n=1 Tax=Dermacentor silvarum TaxID=543639 RepID=A0ACB8DIX9_DERSI|nr:hypothetical protein HPB49_008299 [Dermacentor silvarum]
MGHIDLLGVIHLLNHSWQELAPAKITNCFAHAIFSRPHFGEPDDDHQGKRGKQLEKEVGVISGGGGAGPIRSSNAASAQPPPPGAGPTPPASTSRSGQLEALKQAMSRATTLDQVEHLSSALQSGAPLLPASKKASSSSTRPPGTEDVEMEETNGH